MNAKTTTRQAAAPRAVALIAAVVMTVTLFQFVASLAVPSTHDATAAVYAQAPAAISIAR